MLSTLLFFTLFILDYFCKDLGRLGGTNIGHASNKYVIIVNFCNIFLYHY